MLQVQHNPAAVKHRETESLLFFDCREVSELRHSISSKKSQKSNIRAESSLITVETMPPTSPRTQLSVPVLHMSHLSNNDAFSIQTITKYELEFPLKG